MLKYRLDKVAADGKGGNVVYVRLYDDRAPDITLERLCVAFESQEAFEAELERKTNKYTERVSAKESVKILAEASILKTANKIAEAVK